MARGDDAGKTAGGTRPHRADTRTVQHLDTPDPQPHRHARHRDQEPDRHQDIGHRSGGDRPRCTSRGARGERRAGGFLSACRTAWRRTLRRHRDRPRGRRALRHVGSRTAGGGGRPRGWGEHRRDSRGCGTLSDKPALRARVARQRGAPARAATHHAAGQPDHAGDGGAGERHGRTGHAEERERAALGLGVCGRARSRPRCRGARPEGGSSAGAETRGRHKPRVLGTVRVHGACERTTRGRGARYLADHFSGALPHLLARHGRGAGHGNAALRAYRRHLATLPDGLQPLGCHRRGLHRAGGRGGGIRGDHAALSGACLERTPRGGLCQRELPA